MINFSIRLKELRKSKKLKQSDMAKLLEITTRNYQDYEYGKLTPNAIMLNKLADFFNVSVDYLLGRTNTKYYEKVDSTDRDSINFKITDLTNISIDENATVDGKHLTYDDVVTFNKLLNTTLEFIKNKNK